MLKEGSNRACTDPPQDGAAWFPCCEVSAPTWQFRASATRYCSPGLRSRLPEVHSARARPGVGGAKGMCPLSPVPDWLALPQRGDVFRSTQCFGKERGSWTAADQSVARVLRRSFGASSGAYLSWSLLPWCPAIVRAGREGKRNSRAL